MEGDTEKRGVEEEVLKKIAKNISNFWTAVSWLSFPSLASVTICQTEGWAMQWKVPAGDFPLSSWAILERLAVCFLVGG